MQQNPKAWKQAHERLYEYYKNLPEKELPDTLKEMEPLLAAVRHGCMAGKHQEVLVDVFRERIRRGNEHYTFNKLGAFGADLSCLSYFFEIPWYKPAPGLPEHVKAVVLSWVGSALLALGRLGEALEPMKAGLHLQVGNKNKDYKNIAIAANNISELLLTLGDLKQARDYGKQSVDYADKSGDGFLMGVSRTTFAYALFQAGKVRQAESLFTEAEAMHKKRQPGNLYLYSIQGFQYCDLLVSQRKYKEVLERAKTTLEYEKEGWYRLLDIALDNISIGKALLLESEKAIKPDVSEEEQFLHRAVDDLREAGQQQYLPPGIYALAALYRYKQQFVLSWEDLEEAREIAVYGGMKLYLADYYLEACRNVSCQLAAHSGEGREKGLFVVEEGERVELTEEGMKARFRGFLREAERLVGEMGYYRRDGEIEELKAWGEEMGIGG